MANHARYLTGPIGKQTRPKTIELRQLTTGPEQQPVLDDITLDIFEGEAVAVLGPAGSGKSALLACLLGNLRPTRGEIRLMGTVLPPLSPQIRRQIGIMPQQFDFQTHETVAAYLQRFASYYELQLTTRQIHAYCAHYQLPPSIQVTALTPLQARIFALALALVHDPLLALMDEPLAGLDEAELETFWPYLQRTQYEGRTLLSTFTLPLAQKYLSGYDLVMRLEQGRLIRQEG